MKICFFLMNTKGAFVLTEVLRKFGPQVIEMVITASDAGTELDSKKNIEQTCQEWKVPCFDRISRPIINTRYAIAVGWRWLIHDIPRLIILHDSILPKYRGFNPLVSCLLNKEPLIGVLAIFAEKKFDTGNIIFQRKVEINYPIKISHAIDLITPLYADITLDIISYLKEGRTLPEHPQIEEEVSYSLWRDEEDYLIDWSQSSELIKLHVDSVGFPYLGATSYCDGSKFRIHEIEVIPDVKIENRVSGKIFAIENGLPIVVCGRGLIQIKILKNDQGEKASALPFKKIRSRFAARS